MVSEAELTVTNSSFSLRPKKSLNKLHKKFFVCGFSIPQLFKVLNV